MIASTALIDFGAVTSKPAESYLYSIQLYSNARPNRIDLFASQANQFETHRQPEIQNSIFIGS